MSKNHRIKSLRHEAFKRQGGQCCYCGVRMWLVSPDELPALPRSDGALSKLRCTAEHLVPQSEGGRDTRANIAAACARCNHTRHKRKQPPEHKAYQAEVRRRVERGRWHDRWVFDRGFVREPLKAMSLISSESSYATHQ